MATLSNILKVTQAQYNTLINGGSITVGGVTYTYDSNAIYLVDGGSEFVDLTSDQTIGGAKTFTDPTYMYSDLYTNFIYGRNNDGLHLYDGGSAKAAVSLENGQINLNARYSSATVPLLYQYAGDSASIMLAIYNADGPYNYIFYEPESGNSYNYTLPSASGTFLIRSSAKVSGEFYSGGTYPTNTTRLNYDGYLYTTALFSNSLRLNDENGNGSMQIYADDNVFRLSNDDYSMNIDITNGDFNFDNFTGRLIEYIINANTVRITDLGSGVYMWNAPSSGTRTLYYHGTSNTSNNISFSDSVPILIFVQRNDSSLWTWQIIRTSNANLDNYYIYYGYTRSSDGTYSSRKLAYIPSYTNTTNATASTIALRDTSGDLNAVSFNLCTASSATHKAAMEYDSTENCVKFVF